MYAVVSFFTTLNSKLKNTMTSWERNHGRKGKSFYFIRVTALFSCTRHLTFSFCDGPGRLCSSFCWRYWLRWKRDSLYPINACGHQWSPQPSKSLEEGFQTFLTIAHLSLSYSLEQSWGRPLYWFSQPSACGKGQSRPGLFWAQVATSVDIRTTHIIRRGRLGNMVLMRSTCGWNQKTF